MLNVEHQLFSIIDEFSDRPVPFVGTRVRMASRVEYIPKKEMEDLTIIDVLKLRRNGK